MMRVVTSENFVLINLEGGGAYVFEFFPKEIQSTDRANWEPQDVTLGVKPIFYANIEPRRISVPELYLDGTFDGATINEQIEGLQALKNEQPGKGSPPALLAVWGSRQQRCVMEECVVSEIFFERGGNPLRARVSLQLVELQQEEMVTVNVTPLDVNTKPDSWPF